MYHSVRGTTRDIDTDVLFPRLKGRHAPDQVVKDRGGLLCPPFDPRIELWKEGALENTNELNNMTLWMSNARTNAMDYVDSRLTTLVR